MKAIALNGDYTNEEFDEMLRRFAKAGEELQLELDRLKAMGDRVRQERRGEE